MKRFFSSSLNFELSNCYLMFDRKRGDAVVLSLNVHYFFQLTQLDSDMQDKDWGRRRREMVIQFTVESYPVTSIHSPRLCYERVTQKLYFHRNEWFFDKKREKEPNQWVAHSRQTSVGLCVSKSKVHWITLSCVFDVSLDSLSFRNQSILILGVRFDHIFLSTLVSFSLS
jgi:hypothetical protein